VKRILEPHEILKKYQEDSLFRIGKKYMTLNEYWHLFNLVKDEKELESLYLSPNISLIEEGAFKGCEKLRLTVKTGSYAEKYAVEHEIAMEIKRI
jgi:hypothetical protein